MVITLFLLFDSELEVLGTPLSLGLPVERIISSLESGGVEDVLKFNLKDGFDFSSKDVG